MITEPKFVPFALIALVVVLITLPASAIAGLGNGGHEATLGTPGHGRRWGRE